MVEKAPWENDPIIATATDVAGSGGADAPWELDEVVQPAARQKTYTDDGYRSNPRLQRGLERKARSMRLGREVGPVESALTGAADWAGMGWADEVIGGLGAGLSYLDSDWGDRSFGERFDRIKQNYEDTSDEAWDKHPWAYGMGALPGFAASVAMTPALKGATALSSGLKTGALYGGISGLGQGDDLAERGLNAGIGTVLGGVGGAAFGFGADKASRWLTDRAGRRAVEDMTSDLAGDEAARFGIRTSRGQRTGDVFTQAKENSMAETGMGERAAQVAQEFRAGQSDDIAAALDRTGQRLAGVDPATGQPRPTISQPHEGGELLQDAIQRRVAAETSQLDAANAAQVRQAQSGANAMELGFGRSAQLVDNEVDAGEQVARRVRDAQRDSAATRDAAYDAAANVDARIDRRAIDGMDQRVMEDLTFGRQQPVVVNEQTPSAREALSIISDVAQFRGPRNLADPTGMPDPASITHVSPQGVETVRKRLVALAQDARRRGQASGNFSDAYAMRAIIDEFDNQLERAVQYGLFEGDDTWLEAYQRARSLHRQHRATFRPEDDLRSAMRAIVERDATPEQVANYLFGRSRLGDNLISSRLADHLRGILGQGSEEWAAIRQAAWQKLLTTGTREAETRAITPQNAERIAAQIQEFTQRRGRSFAGVMFEPAELTMMNRFANGLRAMAASQRTPDEHLQVMIDIANRNINPQRFAEILTGGQQALGKNDNSWRLIEAAEAVFGRDSAEWSAIRQTVWRQLIGVPEGKDPKGAKQIANRIFDFVNGPGAPAARRLFDEAERREMQALAGIVRRIAGSADAKNPPKTAAHLNRLLADRGRQMLAALGFVSGGADGGITAFAGAQGSKMAMDAVNGVRAKRLFGGQRDLSAGEAIRDGATRAMLRNSRRGQQLSGPLSGRVLAPQTQGSLQEAFANED